MPLYQIRGLDGNIYQIEGPPGVTKEQIKKKILERAPQAGVPPQEENTLEKIPVVGGLAAGIADLPLGVVSGLANIGKAGAQAFGSDNAVADFLDNVAKGAQDWKSSGAREDALANQIDQQMAEGKGTWEEIKAAGRSFLRSPLDTTAEVAGSAIPFIGAELVTGGAATPLALGVLAGAGTIKGDIHDAVYDEFKKAGASEAQAKAAAEKAQEYGGKNLDQIALGGVLGAIAGATGFAPAIAKTIGARASANLAERLAAREAAEAAGEEIARKSLAKGAAKGVITEAVPEAVQAGQEKYSQNMALRREGFDVDPWAGVAGQAASEGIASIMLGGYGGMRETQHENAAATAKQYASKVEKLPDNPTEEDVAPIAEWAVRRGFSEEEAAIIAKNAAEQKARVAKAKADTEEALKKTREMRTANVEPIFESDVGAPPPVDPEEQAAMEQAYAAEAGAAPSAPTGPTPPSVIPPLETITPQAQISEQLAAVRPNEAELDTASLNGALKMYGSISARGVKAPEPLVNMLASKLLDASASGQLDAIAASDLGPVVQQFFTNEAATINELATNKAPPASAAPVKAAPQITPDVAQQLINNIEQRPELQSEIEASTGLTLDDLYDIAEGTQAKYSRGRRPKDTQTEDLFGALPMQAAPGEDLKRDEYNAQRFASDEEKAAREQQFAEEMQAGQERALALSQREAEQRKETLDDIEYALRAQAPENAVYRVDYDATDANAPYKLVAETQLGKKPEEVIRAKTLQDFSDQVYGRMMELTPYVPPAPAGIEEIEQREPTEQEAPTVATRMVQDFTAEVDAAREAGQIDNAQRSELLQRLQRPNAYRTLPNGREVPNDAIAKLEAKALEAASVLRNAPAEEQEAAKAAVAEANKKLRAAVKNSLLNPARAKLKSMVEMRQDERVGAKVRIKEAESVIGKFEGAEQTQREFGAKRKPGPQKYERKPGTPESAEQLGIEGIGENKIEAAQRAALRKKQEGTKATNEATFGALPEVAAAELREAKKEAREAKIDLKESKVQKYRRGAEKQPGGAPKVVAVDAVQSMVDKITSQWKSTNPVKVIASVDDIPDAKLRRAIKRDKAEGANGLVAPDGTIYLLADNLLSMEDAKAVLFHEALGHTGLEKLFRNNLDNALVTMYRGNAQLKADTDKWRTENPDAYKNDKNPLARAIEEVLAERSEKGQLDRTLFQKIAAIVRNFARRMGINLKISDGDVAAILSMAHDKVVKGDTESTIVKGLRYVTAWHGSPHDFDKFTTEKIGTGEGAQIFGWGLYFTDTKQIAERFYRDRLSDTELVADGKSLRDQVKAAAEAVGADPLDVPGLMQKIDLAVTINSQYSGSGPTELEHVAKDLLDAAYSYQDELSEAERKRDARRTKELASVLRSTITELEILNKLGNLKVTRKSSGKLYNVELKPDDDSWLLWDAPLSKQSPKVIEAMKSLGFTPRSTLQKALDSLTLPRALRLDLTGGQMYRLLTEEFMGDAKQASLALLAAGVRGNKYLDGNSRGMGIDTPGYNYVVFQDEDVELTAKYSRKKAKTSEADAKKVENADERLSVGARRVDKSFSTAGIADGLGDMSAGRKSKEWAGAMWQNWGLFSPNARKGLLKSMPSSGILGWVKPEFKMLHEQMQEIDERVHKMNALKQRIIAAGDELAKEIRDFNDEHGTRELAVLMGTARINELDPFAFSDVDAALKGDAVMQEIEKNILKNSNDPKASQKLIDDIKAIVMANKDSVKVKGDKYIMSAKLLNLSRALGKASKDQQKSTQHVEQLSEMTRRIRDTYAARADLDAQRGGARIYKEVRQFYKDMFEAEQALLDERINSIADPDEAVRIKDMRAKLMREVVSPEERRKGGDLFWDLDADLFQKDYFPFMREGDHWLRVNAAKDGSREREFYTFRTPAELHKAQNEIAKRLGVDPEDNNVIEIGYDVGRLQENLRSEDLLMQRVFDIVGKERQKYEASGNINLKELTDAIYQTWLMTTPERSVRRRLMHAEEVVGFSPDVFLHFREQVTTYANQLSKLAYAGQVRMAVEEARDVINDPERPASERAKWRMFVDEFEDRANSEMNPTPQSAVINFLNRNSYYYYLTSAKTALLQVLTVPIRVVPRLWRDYGYAKGTAMWIKYMKMWNSLGRVKTEKGASNYGEWLDGIMPSVNGSQFVKNNADLQWALKMGTERGILETLHDTLVQNERATPGKTATGAAKTFEDVRGNIGKTMSFLFNGMENISRQASYYMTFELALEKYRKENPSASNDEARNYAFKQAMDVVRNTAGDFSSWERPTIAKGNLGRAVFLFKMHPITQTRFMVGAMRDMARGTKALVSGGAEQDKAEGIGALKELSGVLMMTGMFGGLMGMPLYSAMTYALMAAFGPDDDDDKDVLALMGGDPRVAYDPDIAFRSWMNEKFGDIKIGDMSLADILVSGPVSAATNTELSSATSLDLKNLWWRDAVVGDSLEESAVQTAIANIAGISMVAQIMRGFDSFKEGKIEDGLKKTLPAFFRTWVNAAVNEQEGVKNRRGDVLIDKKDIGAADNIRDVLGFRAPKLSRIQQYYITRAKNETAIKAERNAILDRLETAVNNGEIKNAADYEKFKKEEIVPFNRTYPAHEFVITDKVVRDSVKRRGQIRARTIEGVQFDKKTTSGEFAAQRRFVQ